MVKVFLSHNFLDKGFVRFFGEDLKAAGVLAWFDEVKLKIGDSLPLEIASAITASDYVLAFLSHNSIGSPWVQKEIAIASALEINGEEIKVLPLRLDSSKMPALLADKLYANFEQPAQYDSEFRKVLRSIAPGALPDSQSSFNCLTIGDTRKDRLVRAAEDQLMKAWILDYLIFQIRQRHTERHFVYLALGEIGGARAMAAIEKGLSDSNEFARMGAERARTLLTKH